MRSENLERIYTSDGESGSLLINGQRRSLSRSSMANRLFELNPLAGILRAHRNGRLLAHSLSVGGQTDAADSILATFVDGDDFAARNRSRLDRRYQVRIDRSTRLVRSLTFLGSTNTSASYLRPRPPLNVYHYEDYRTVDGLTLPFRIRLLDGSGNLLGQMLIEQFQTTDTPPDMEVR